MVTDAATLLNLSNCYRCVGVTSMAQLLKLSLLAQIAKQSNPMADTSPQGLLSAANCYRCFGGGDTGFLLEMGLLFLIASGGGIGGGAGLVGNGPPTAAATAGTTYLDKISENFWVNSDGTASGWVELIGS